MLIETYDKVYAVIRHYYAGLHMDIYVCKCRSDRQLYAVIRVRNKKITEKILEFISTQKNSRKFSDLVDAFVHEGDLHVVFSYTEGLALERKLEQPCTLEERMEIGRKLLERMILSQQPYYFQCQCLSPENIVVTQALDVRFRYTLRNIENYEAYTMQHAAAYLYRTLKLLFVPEFQKNVIAPMADYFGQLREAGQLDYLAQYQLYCAACEAVRQIPEAELEIPKNFMYHVWNLIKSMRGRLKRSILTLVFIGVFLYMLYSIYWSLRAKGYVWHFDAIGTLQLEEETADQIVE